MSKINNFKKIISVIALFCLLVIFRQVKTYPHIPLKGLFKVLKVDDIGFAHALLHSKWIENMYQYGPGKPHRKVPIKKGKDTTWRAEYKSDAVANLIRKLWFRKSENHQLLPTKLGCLAYIPDAQLGKVFGKLINYVYKGLCQDPLRQGSAEQRRSAQDNREEILIDELFAHDPKIKKINHEFVELSRKLAQEKAKFNNKKFSGLQEATKKFRNEVKQLREKYRDIGFKQKLKVAKKNFGKKTKKQKLCKIENFNKAVKAAEKKVFLGFSQQVLDARDEYKKIVREVRDLQDKIKKKIKQKRDIVNKALFDPIRKAAQLCSSGEKYVARTTESILWALFFHKIDNLISLQQKIATINDCINVIKKEFKNQDYQDKIELKEFYDKKDFDLFEKNFKKANTSSQDVTCQLLLDYCHVDRDNCDQIDQIDRVFKHYDVGLHYFIHLVAGAFPLVVSQGDYGYEYESGKISHARPDCHETALLDLFSILWYNQKTKAYDNSLFSENIIKNGEGFRKLREALKYFYLADVKKIKADEYTCTCEVRAPGDKTEEIAFTSLAKLKNLGKITSQEVQALDISKVPVFYITRSEIKQEFFNIVSEIPGVIYCSKVAQVKERGKIFEIKSDARNILKILNYFYGTCAKSITELGAEATGISTGSREIMFEQSSEQDGDTEIKISVSDSENASYFDMVVHIGACHTYPSVDRRDESAAKILKKGFAIDLCSKLSTMKHRAVFMLLASKKVLKNAKANWSLPILNLVYYSLAMKTPEIKLAIIKDVLERHPRNYNAYKEMIRNLLEKFPVNDGYLKGELNKTILISGLYKEECFLENFIKKDSNEKLLYDVITFSNKNQEKEVLSVYKDLAAEIPDINKVQIMDSAIVQGYKKIVELIKQREEFSIDKNSMLFCDNVLCAAIKGGFVDIALDVVNHEKFDVFDTGNVLSFVLKMFHQRYDERYKTIACKILENSEFDDWDQALRSADKQGWNDVVFDLVMHEKFAGDGYWFRSIFKVALKNLVLLKSAANSDVVLQRYKEVVCKVANHHVLKSQKQQMKKFFKIAKKAGNKYVKKHPERCQEIREVIKNIKKEHVLMGV